MASPYLIKSKAAVHTSGNVQETRLDMPACALCYAHVCAGLLKQTGEAASALMPDGLLPDLFDDLDPLDLDHLDSGLLDGVPEGTTMVIAFLCSADA